MKLYSDATTPFGRKVMIAAIERAVPLEEIFVDLKNPAILELWNPLRQIPTLVLDGGEAVFDSDVIIAFLDTRHSGTPLVPPKSATAVMTRMSIANGLMETTLKRVIESRREPPSAAVLKKLEATIARVLKALDARLGEFTMEQDVLRADHIALVAALGYVDLRYKETWRNDHPALATWYAGVSDRKSVLMTAPSRKVPVSAH